MSFSLSQILEFREESRIRYEANKAQEAALIQAEREYWTGMLSKASSLSERDRILDELEALRVLERAS